MSQFLIIAGSTLQLNTTLWFILGFNLDLIKLSGCDRSPQWIRISNIMKYPAAVGSFGIIIVDVGQHTPPTTVHYVLSTWTFFCWWLCRNDHDDDFTKKLKKMITEKIQQIGAKLVVVPETT